MNARSIAAAALLLGLALAAFWPAIGQGFVNYDDPSVIVDNPVIEGPTLDHVRSVFGSVRDHAYLPLYYASFWIDHAVAGKEPWIYHLLNVLIHGLVGVLLWRLLRRLEARPASPWPLAAAALFVVHPTLTESVAWASGRKDVLSMALMLGALIAWDRGLASGRRAPLFVWPLVLLVPALFTKATVLVFPALAFLLRRQRLAPGAKPGAKPGAAPRRSALALALHAAVTAAAVAVHVAVASSEGTIGGTGEGALGARILGMIGVLARYLGHMLLPVDLAVCHHVPFDGSFAGPELNGVLVLIAGAACAVWWWRSRSLAALGAVWWLVALIPFNNVVPRSSVAMADRYLYIGAAGFVLVVAMGLKRLSGRLGRAPVLAAMAVLIVAGVLLTRREVVVWRSSEALWRRALAVAPEETLPYLQLGHALETRAAGETGPAARGMLEEACDLYASGLRRARRATESAQARVKLSAALVRLADYERGLHVLDELDAELMASSVPLDPADRDNLRVTRATALVGLGRLDEAERELTAVSDGSPAAAAAVHMRANVAILRATGELAQAGSDDARRRARERFDLGLALYDELLERWPRHLPGRLDHVRALMRAPWVPDQILKVARAVTALVEDFPESAAAHVLYAKAYAEDPAYAAPHLKIALRLDPYRVDAYLLLSRLTRARGRNKEAKLILDRGLEVLPGDERLCRELADTYVAFGYHHKNTKAPDLALEAAERALDLVPDLVEAHLLAGEVEQELATTGSEETRRDPKHWEEAARHFQRARELDPASARARVGLAHYHRVRGYAFLARISRDTRHLEGEDRRDAKREIRRLGMEEFRTAVELAAGDEAFSVLRELLDQYAGELEAGAEEALEDLRAPEALVLAERALRMRGESAGGLCLLGRVHARLGRNTEALAAFRRALAADGEHVRTLYEMGRLLYLEHDWKRARDTLGRFVTRAATYGDTLEEAVAAARSMIAQCSRRIGQDKDDP